MFWTSQLKEKLRALKGRGAALDQWEEISDLLLEGDVAFDALEKLKVRVEAKVKAQKITDQWQGLREVLLETLQPLKLTPQQKHRLFEATPNYSLLLGVNGVGKTTTIAKWLHRLGPKSSQALLVAADTYRAAAAEQLAIWAQSSNVSCVIDASATPATLIHRGLQTMAQQEKQHLIVDTSGRLPNQINLIEELKKIERILTKHAPDCDKILVLDACQGHNAYLQLETFYQAVKITGIVLTKVDSGAKGGVLLSIALNQKYQHIPIVMLGKGERAADWADFSPNEFVDALISDHD